jgi:hypothetical protein
MIELCSPVDHPKKEHLFGAWLSPFSMIPNSSIGILPGVGDGSVPAVLTLAQRPNNEEFFGGSGVDIADVRFEIQGIMVEVSLGRLPTKFNNR